MIFARSSPALRNRSTLPHGRLARQVKPPHLRRGASELLRRRRLPLGEQVGQ